MLTPLEVRERSAREEPLLAGAAPKAHQPCRSKSARASSRREVCTARLYVACVSFFFSLGNWSPTSRANRRTIQVHETPTKRTKITLIVRPLRPSRAIRCRLRNWRRIHFFSSVSHKSDKGSLSECSPDPGLGGLPHPTPTPCLWSHPPTKSPTR